MADETKTPRQHVSQATGIPDPVLLWEGLVYPDASSPAFVRVLSWDKRVFVTKRGPEAFPWYEDCWSLVHDEPLRTLAIGTAALLRAG